MHIIRQPQSRCSPVHHHNSVAWAEVLMLREHVDSQETATVTSEGAWFPWAIVLIHGVVCPARFHRSLHTRQLTAG